MKGENSSCDDDQHDKHHSQLHMSVDRDGKAIRRKRKFHETRKLTLAGFKDMNYKNFLEKMDRVIKELDEVWKYDRVYFEAAYGICEDIYEIEGEEEEWEGDEDGFYEDG